MALSKTEIEEVMKFTHDTITYDKIEKIFWQELCETHKIIGTWFSSTNITVPDHAFILTTSR